MSENAVGSDDESDSVDPIEFVRRALRISPEDAAKVREDAAKAPRRDEQEDEHEDERND